MKKEKQNGLFDIDIPDRQRTLSNTRLPPSVLVVLGILGLTRETSFFSVEDLREAIRFHQQNAEMMVTEKVVRDLLKNQVIQQVADEGDRYWIQPLQRLQVIPSLLQHGVDFEIVSQLLNWQEFEKFCLLIIESHNFRCHRNFRFSHLSKRYEIDVVALRSPLILVVDAKRWASKISNQSALIEAIKSQYTRAQAFKLILSDNKVLTKLHLENWKKAEIVPIVVSIFDQNVFIQPTGVVIPIFRLNNFLLNIRRGRGELPVINTDVTPQNVSLVE